jgi:hypothetical protein
MVQPNTTDPKVVAPSPSAVIGADVAQMGQLLTCGLEAWVAYWTACFAARSLDDLYRANAGLAAQGLTLVGHAASERQRVDGEVIPTLNDA